MGKKLPELYRIPRKPGYLGGYNWRATALGCLLLVVVNFVATQYIAARFQYQAALGAPILRGDVWRHLPNPSRGFRGDGAIALRKTSGFAGRSSKEK